MPRILVVADEPWVRNEVHATLTMPGFELVDHDEPSTAADTAVATEADAVIVDLQVGAMGGMAVTRSVRAVTGSSTSRGLPVILLLDRTADGFLAKRAGAAAWLTKPLTSHQLASALEQALGGDDGKEKPREEAAE